MDTCPEMVEIRFLFNGNTALVCFQDFFKFYFSNVFADMYVSKSKRYIIRDKYHKIVGLYLLVEIWEGRLYTNRDSFRLNFLNV